MERPGGLRPLAVEVDVLMRGTLGKGERGKRETGAGKEARAVSGNRRREEEGI